MDADLRAWGDRASSMQSALPIFQSFRAESRQGQVRWTDLGRGVWFAGAEPWAPEGERAGLLAAFAKKAREAGAHAVMGPLSRELAQELLDSAETRCSVICVGAEALFTKKRNLHVELARLPLARALIRKGYSVERKAGAVLSAFEREAIGRILSDRGRALQSEQREELGLLSTVDPFFLAETREYFFIRNSSGEIEAYGSFQPIMRDGKTEGHFAAEYFRSQGARAGVIELLLCYAATELPRLSLGLSPFALLPTQPVPKIAAWLTYHLASRPFSPKSLHQFKAKLGVTEWRPLYVAVSPGLSPRVMATLAQKFVSQQIVGHLPFGTLALVAACLFLHGIKSHPAFATLSSASGYRMDDISLWGWLSGPFLHNNVYHLSGDLLSLAIFGAAYEWLRGRRAWLATVAAGLWLSNPLAHALLLPLGFPPEVDLGSSNAVYALVGAVASTVAQPWLLLAPFAVNGLLVMVGKGSALAIHHWVALALGWWIGRRVEAAVRR